MCYGIPMSNEIACTTCGKTALARREPRYEGFRKVGEDVVCTACGHRYDGAEATPFVDRPKGPSVFGEDDKPVAVKVFREDERGRCCGHCRHFVVNPFTERCGLHNRRTQATDLCFDFAGRTEG